MTDEQNKKPAQECAKQKALRLATDLVARGHRCIERQEWEPGETAEEYYNATGTFTQAQLNESLSSPCPCDSLRANPEAPGYDAWVALVQYAGEHTEDPARAIQGITSHCLWLHQENERLRAELSAAKAQELNWSNQLKGEIETRKEWEAANEKADKRIAELEKYLNACAFGDVRVVKESGGFSYVLLSQPSTYTYDSIEEAIAAALLKEKP